MDPLFHRKRVLLVGGPGGVGKTTLAASLATSLALNGHRTMVLTVDPARRLAQALGLDGLSTENREVFLGEHATRGKLFASMLDTRRYFDRIIERFATNSSQRERILTNPVYRTMVDNLGGTHEYAAMERLLEFAKNPDYDRVVIDTPPSQNAIDLLSAPQRLADFMDNSVLKWFQKGAPAYLQLFRTGTKLAMKLLRSIFGSEFLDTFEKFMNDIEGMQAGFRQRNQEVLELLRSEQAAFLLVTSPTEDRLRETISLAETLQQARIGLAAIVLNRVAPFCPAPTTSDAETHRALQYLNQVWSSDQSWVEKFRKQFAQTPVFIVPRSEPPPRDIESLASLARYLE